MVSAPDCMAASLSSDLATSRATSLTAAWSRAATERVEVACAGGHGRTGTALACLAVLDGIPAAATHTGGRGCWTGGSGSMNPVGLAK